MHYYTKAYICHPYADDPEGNISKVLQITKDITEQNKSAIDNCSPTNLVVPIAVHLLFPKFMSEDTLGREIAMEFYLRVLESCNQVWVYGPVVSEGMRQEISYACKHGIEVVWKNF